ncbi:NAD(P)/FAD-dependent oxidoreductase [Actinoplanes awajinensis]|uniref:NAD(P)/FAD-dependent oxidoreductase n=1 Tax=Actinoplanes awajinensis TaxID=135946 RepID=UPI00082E8969|nr:FAD-dependent oxidoreductase [Actinoplanes awajinensis]
MRWGPDSRIVVAGAGIGGLRTAEALRTKGFAGRLTVVGEETHFPYDRPPLSKQLLTGAIPVSATTLATDVPVEWLLGRRIVELDRERRVLRLDGGDLVPFDALVIATGARARDHPGAVPHPGLFTVRRLEDSVRLAALLRRPGLRVAVVGGGVLANEVAAAARTTGASTTLIDRGGSPLRRLGPEAGAFVARAHRLSGVHLMFGTAVTSMRAARSGGTTVRTDNPQVPAVDVDAVVIAIGGRPNTEWARSAGLAAAPAGELLTDHFLRATDRAGIPQTDIVVVGDAGARPHPVTPGAFLAEPHWSNAVRQADTAAETLLGGPVFPHRALPSFWSDVHDLKLRVIGLPGLADTRTVVESDATARRLVVRYTRDGAPVALLTINRTSRLAHHRPEIAATLNADSP